MAIAEQSISQPWFLPPSPRVPIPVESHSLRCVSSATRSNLSSWNKTSPRSGREMVQGWCTGDTPTLPSLPHCVLALRTDPPSVLKSPYSSSELVDTNLDLLPAPCLAPRACIRQDLSPACNSMLTQLRVHNQTLTVVLEALRKDTFQLVLDRRGRRIFADMSCRHAGFRCLPTLSPAACTPR